MSSIANILYALSILFVCFAFYKKRSIKSTIVYISFIILGVSVFYMLTAYIDRRSSSKSSSSKEINETLSFDSDVYTLSVGTRMGDGYKADFCALQACTVYNGKLYQFFNKGYYEIRDTSTMELLEEGKLNLPVDIHFGVVEFSNMVEKRCTMPYLYATDDAGKEGCVYVIDFEKQKIVSNYNVTGGSIAAFDFENQYGYIVSTVNKNIDVEKFDLKSGEIIELVSMPVKKKLETLQSVVFYEGRLYLLSGETGKSLILSDIDVYNMHVEIHSFPFNGEPEGLFFKGNGDVVVTANMGKWGGDKNSKDYIHSECFILRKRQ